MSWGSQDQSSDRPYSQDDDVDVREATLGERLRKKREHMVSPSPEQILSSSTHSLAGGDKLVCAHLESILLLAVRVRDGNDLVSTEALGELECYNRELSISKAVVCAGGPEECVP